MSNLLSIIIPCYNCAAFLEEALLSLEKQTADGFEVILVNDGSEDNTLQILRDWERRGSLNIRILDQPNGGVSSARNAGIRTASGEYLLFLDADDIYHETFVEQMLSAVQERNADTVYCRLSRDLDAVRGFVPSKRETVLKSQQKAMDDLLFRMGSYGVYCYLYRKELLGEIRFAEHTLYGEDREFNWKYLSRCSKIVWIDMPLYGYRIHPDSATQRKAVWRKTDVLTAVRRTESFLRESGCPYADTFCDYMYDRAMWSVAKSFAISHNRELFSRLRKEYDVRTCMKRTSKDSSRLVALASVLYRIHPMLFYYGIGLRKR